MSSEPRAAAVESLVAVRDLDLEGFVGLVPSTRKSDVIDSLGPIVGEGVGWGHDPPTWMTTHEISTRLTMTAYYDVTADDGEPDDRDPLAWIERPIEPDDVRDLSIARAPDAVRTSHLVTWPDRGLCVRVSRRSRLPTLLLAFVPCSKQDFLESRIARSE